MFFKCKFKNIYLFQNNSVLKFRNASDETTSSAIKETLKMAFLKIQNFWDFCCFGLGVSKDQEVQHKLSSWTSRTCSRRH